MDKAVPERARHVLVDLRDHQFGRLRGVLGIVDGNAQAAVAVPIRPGNVDDRHVKRHSGIEKLRDLIEKARGIIPVAGPDGVLCRRTRENGVVAEVLFHSRLCVRRGGKRNHVGDLHILQLVRMPHQCVIQINRSARPVGGGHPVTGFDMRDRFVGGHLPLRIQFFPIHLV